MKSLTVEVVTSFGGDGDGGDGGRGGGGGGGPMGCSRPVSV